MVRKNRKPKDYTFSTFADEDYDDENPGVITDADGTRRTTRPGEVQEVLVGDALLAEQAAHQELRDQDEDEPENRQRTSSLAHTADLTVPAAGSEPANRQRTSSLAHPADLTAPATGSRGTATPSPSSSRDPRKPKRIPWKPTPRTKDESTSPTPAEMAAMQKKYTYSEAVRLINVPPVATTDDEFRNELADFWDNWRTLNIKTEGSTPKAWTREWRNYKIVNVLLARYRKFCGGIIKQQLAAQQTQTVIVNVATTAGQPSPSTSAVDPSAQQPSTSTEATTTVTSTTTVTTSTTITTDDAMDSSTAPDTTSEALPQLELAPHEMEVLDQGNILQDMDPEAVARIQAYLLTDNPDEIIDAPEEQADAPEQMEASPTPPQCLAHTADTEGAKGSYAAHTAATDAGGAGEAQVVLSVPPPPPPRTASASQSGKEDQKRTSPKRNPEEPSQSGKPVAKSSSPADRLSPGIERHLARRSKKYKLLHPIIDLRVYKESAAKLKLQGVELTPWVDQFHQTGREYLGQINAWQVPWSYLPEGAYNNLPEWRDRHALKDITLGHVMAENARLPYRYILAHTFGIDPWLRKLVTEKTRQELTAIALQKYWEPCPGFKLRVGGIGPTGFDLRGCADYNKTFHGQRKAFIRLAQAAAAAGKCLSIRIDKDDAAGSIDLHREARKAIREAGIKREHPILLQNLRATHEHLCDWLEEFPNAIIAFEYKYVAFLEDVVQYFMPNQQDSRYVEAQATLQFIKAAPLKNIAVQSGAYNPDGDNIPMEPHHINLAADVLQRVTGTPSLVYHENTAVNAVRLYQLNAALLDRMARTDDPSSDQRTTIENLRQHIHTVLPAAAAVVAPAARADRDDQEQPPAERSVADRLAHTADGQPEDALNDRPAHTAGDQPQGAHVVPSVPPPAPIQRRSTSRSPMDEDKRDEDPKKVASKTKGIRHRSRSMSSRSNRSNSSLSTGSSSPGPSRRRAPSDSGAKSLRESLEGMLRSGLGKMVKGVSPPRSSRRSRSRSRDKGNRRSRSRSRDKGNRRSRSRSRDKRRQRSRSRSRRSRSSSKHSRFSDRHARSDADRRGDRKREDGRRRDDRHPDDLQREVERRRQDRLRDEERRKREDQRKDRHRSKDRSPQDKPRRSKTDSGEGDRHSRSARPTPPTDRRAEHSPSSRDTSASQRGASPTFARPAIPTDRQARKQVRAPTPDTRDASLASSQRSFRTPTADASMASSRASSALSRVYTSRQREGVMIPTALSTARGTAAPYQPSSRTERRLAHTADGAPTVRRDSNNSLFKTQPLPPAWTLRPTEEVINSFTDEIFGDHEDPNLRVRAVALSELRSQTIDPPAQPETFAVPPESTWHPEERCTRAAEERPCFHPTVKDGKWINLKRWKTTPAFKDPELLKALRELGDMQIFTLGHHILVSWAVRLKNKDNRVRYIVHFLHRVLQTFDWAQGIPALIAEFQPLMVDEDTTTPWPEYFHFKQGAERWVSTCEFAYRYLFDRLSGSLRFRPTWLQTTNVHEDLRNSINNEMLGRASEMFNELRHVIYRQYGLRHVRAELSRETIYWEPFASSSNRDSTRHGRLLLGQTIVFAEEPVYHAFSPMLRDSVEMIAIRDGNRAAIRAEVFNCFPGDTVSRVVFWLGRNFIVEGNHDDFDKLIQEMCYVYAKYFGNIEVFVVLPPYARTHRVRWMSQALRLLVEQEDILPYARVALYTSDVQLYEHDHRLGVNSSWPAALGTSEDGRYLTDYTIEGRKKYLMEEHGLDLWQNYSRVSIKAAHHLIDYASTPIPDSARVDVDYTSAPPTRPDSPASTAASTSALAGSSALPTPQTETDQPAPAPIVQAIPGPSTSAASAGPDMQATVNAILQQQAQLFQQQQEQHNQQLQRMIDLIASQAAALQPPPRPKKHRRRDKDQFSDHSD